MGKKPKIKIEIEVRVVPSLLGPQERHWWQAVDGWAALAEIVAWARLEADGDAAERDLARLVGPEVAAALHQYTNEVLLGLRPPPMWTDAELLAQAEEARHEEFRRGWEGSD